MSFSDLPGIGRKTAEKFVFYLLNRPKDELNRFANHLVTLQNNTYICPVCFNFSENAGPCYICADQKRNSRLLCVVEKIHDLNMIESTGEYRGLYHVLGGEIDLIEGITPDKLTIAQLETRIKNSKPEEIILAINPDMQGESTILYLKKLLQPYQTKISVLARGLPMGADIEYADESTLCNALRGRTQL